MVFSALSLLVTLPAFAQSADTLHPFASYAILYDDNVLGLASREAAVASTASGKTDDVLRTARLGLQLQKTLGRQHVAVDMDVTDVKFDRYAQLDYQGRVLKAVWDWRIGNGIDGTASTSYARSLMAFDDYHALARRLQTEQNDRVDFRWRFHPRWRLRGAISWYKVAYDGDTLFFGDRNEHAGEAGWDYLTRADSSMGVVARRINGSDANALTPGLISPPNYFRQNEIRLRVDWRPTGKLRLQLNGGTVSRKYTSLTTNNFQGGNGRVDADWTITGKTYLHASMWRELGIVDDLVAYSINRGFSLGPVWEITPKVRMDFLWRIESRDFRSPRGLTQIEEGDMRRSVVWSTKFLPDTHWLVLISLVQTTKTDQGPFTSFIRRTAGASAQYAF